MVKKSLIKGQFTNLSRLGKVTWDDDLFPLGKVKEGRLNITRLDRQGKKTLPELRKGSSYSCHCDSLKGPPDSGSIPESRVRSPLLMLPGRKKPGCLKKKKKKSPDFFPPSLQSPVNVSLSLRASRSQKEREAIMIHRDVFSQDREKGKDGKEI